MRTVRTAFHSSPDSSILDLGVKGVSISAAEGQIKTHSRDKLCRIFGPQTFQDALSIVERVARMKAEKDISKMKFFR